MAKMFYTLEEAVARLGVSEQWVDQMVAQGSLQQFRDRDKRMFKVDEVEDRARRLPTSMRENPSQERSAGVARLPIFLSYRREDSADISGRIYDRLVNSFHRDAVFKDVDSIPLGFDFRDHLQRAVSECEVFLVVIGPKWLDVCDHDGRRRLDNANDFVRIEVEAALSRSLPVIPLLVGGATMPRPDDLPLAIRALSFRQAIAVRSDPDFHRDMDRLLSYLASYGKGRS